MLLTYLRRKTYAFTHLVKLLTLPFLGGYENEIVESLHDGSQHRFLHFHTSFAALGQTSRSEQHQKYQIENFFLQRVLVSAGSTMCECYKQAKLGDY